MPLKEFLDTCRDKSSIKGTGENGKIRKVDRKYALVTYAKEAERQADELYEVMKRALEQKQARLQM